MMLFNFLNNFSNIVLADDEDHGYKVGHTVHVQKPGWKKPIPAKVIHVEGKKIKLHYPHNNSEGNALPHHLMPTEDVPKTDIKETPKPKAPEATKTERPKEAPKPETKVSFTKKKFKPTYDKRLDENHTDENHEEPKSLVDRSRIYPEEHKTAKPSSRSMPTWWLNKTNEQQHEYVKLHPNSKYADHYNEKKLEEYNEKNKHEPVKLTPIKEEDHKPIEKDGFKSGETVHVLFNNGEKSTQKYTFKWMDGKGDAILVNQYGHEAAFPFSKLAKPDSEKKDEHVNLEPIKEEEHKPEETPEPTHGGFKVGDKVYHDNLHSKGTITKLGDNGKVHVKYSGDDFESKALPEFLTKIRDDESKPETPEDKVEDKKEASEHKVGDVVHYKYENGDLTPDTFTITDIDPEGMADIKGSDGSKLSSVPLHKLVKPESPAQEKKQEKQEDKKVDGEFKVGDIVKFKGGYTKTYTVIEVHNKTVDVKNIHGAIYKNKSKDALEHVGGAEPTNESPAAPTEEKKSETPSFEVDQKVKDKDGKVYTVVNKNYGAYGKILVKDSSGSHDVFTSEELSPADEDKSKFVKGQKVWYKNSFSPSGYDPAPYTYEGTNEDGQPLISYNGSSPFPVDPDKLSHTNGESEGSNKPKFEDSDKDDDGAKPVNEGIGGPFKVGDKIQTINGKGTEYTVHKTHGKKLKLSDYGKYYPMSAFKYANGYQPEQTTKKPKAANGGKMFKVGDQVQFLNSSSTGTYTVQKVHGTKIKINNYGPYYPQESFKLADSSQENNSGSSFKPMKLDTSTPSAPSSKKEEPKKTDDQIVIDEASKPKDPDKPEPGDLVWNTWHKTVSKLVKLQNENQAIVEYDGKEFMNKPKELKAVPKVISHNLKKDDWVKVKNANGPLSNYAGKALQVESISSDGQSITTHVQDTKIEIPISELEGTTKPITEHYHTPTGGKIFDLTPEQAETVSISSYDWKNTYKCPGIKKYSPYENKHPPYKNNSTVTTYKDYKIFCDTYYKDSADQLSQSQKNTLISYKSSGYQTINNGTLRKHNGEVITQAVKNIDAAIEAMPGIPEEMQLFRGLFLAKDERQIGAIHKDYGFMSSAPTPKGGFGSHMVKIIGIPKGTKMLPLYGGMLGNNSCETEDEFLLPRGAALEIIKIEHNAVSSHGGTVYVAQYHAPDSEVALNHKKGSVQDF